jgi:DNA recombination protein RmuC
MILTFVCSCIAFGIGIAITWFITTATYKTQLQNNNIQAQAEYNTLEKDYIAFKATTNIQLSTADSNTHKSINEISNLHQLIEQKKIAQDTLNSQLATTTARLQAANDALINKQQEIDQLKKDVDNVQKSFHINNRLLATAEAENKSLQNNLESQKQTIDDINKKFTTEFENIANKILESKTQKFTELNKENLKNILEPLGKNIDDFKKQVDEVYKAESNERFSLGKEVKKLSELNQSLTDEAKNLTKALKGEAKTQGRWGEVILENILDKSGLRKGEEYFMEYQLFDAEGKPLRSESEGKKMRPDALVKYPDSRHIIIDAKVSLNAFVRFIESDDTTLQKIALEAHIAAIKTHINDLSKKAYDDYDKTLDFVMMFIPNEPAYITAMQGEPDLWNYAYERRVLLISPTNLIAALKLMVDLWKREYQNLHAQAIAERGAKMYDKFVGFIQNLEDVGIHLDKAQGKFADAYKQLNTGNDNLVSQATKLRALGLKTKKELPTGIGELAIQNDHSSEI